MQPGDRGAWGPSLGQLGQQWAQALQWGAQALQDSTVADCRVCGRRVLRPKASICQECGQPYCQACAAPPEEAQRPASPAQSPTAGAAIDGTAVDVCVHCGPVVQKRRQAEAIRERLQRTEAFLAGKLDPYAYSPESKLEQSFRLGGQVLEGARHAAVALPLEAWAAISVGYYLIRSGPLVLTGSDVVKALQLLVGLVMKLDTEALLSSSPRSLFGGLYYMMGEFRGVRGRMPELERQEHVGGDGKVPTPPMELLSRLRHACRVLHAVTYSGVPSPPDAQRLIRQVLPGSELVLAELSPCAEVPTYMLACCRETRKAYLILPGTQQLSDFVTDFNADPEEFLHGVAHQGMARSATWLMEEVSPVLLRLHGAGFGVELIGHSLGAAVAGLLTLLLRAHLPSVFCYGFGTPACVDRGLVDFARECMVSVVHRDDVVPRLTIQSVQGLAERALCPGQTAKTTAWLDEDWAALQDVQRIVELRRRAVPNPPRDARTHEEKLRLLVDAGVARDLAERALSRTGDDLARALLYATEEEATLKAPPTAAEPEPEGLAAAALSAAAFSAACAPVSAPGPPKSPAYAHPQFFVPGQVVHLYQENGLGRAALTDCTHDALAHIIPAENMLEDHVLAAYDEALRQACIEDPRAPQWEAFDERRTCACCQSDFAWAYVLRSEPQLMLARHHCFACGKVVCDGCSQVRKPHPIIGFDLAVRTCDRCAFGLGAGPERPDRA